MSFNRFFLVLSLIFVPILSAQDAKETLTPAQLRKLEAKINHRRDLRRVMGYTEARSYTPQNDFHLPPDDCPGFPVGLAAQLLANGRKKEVLVSCLVSSRMLDLDRTTAKEAEIIDALHRLKVQVSEIGASVIVLTENQ